VDLNWYVGFTSGSGFIKRDKHAICRWSWIMLGISKCNKLSEVSVSSTNYVIHYASLSNVLHHKAVRTTPTARLKQMRWKVKWEYNRKWCVRGATILTSFMVVFHCLLLAKFSTLLNTSQDFFPTLHHLW